MKKKIYDGEKTKGLDLVFPSLDGCESINQHFHLSHFSTKEVKYYHITPEGVAVMYASSSSQNGLLSPVEHRAQIWLYGTEKAVGKLEQRINTEIEKWHSIISENLCQKQ